MPDAALLEDIRQLIIKQPARHDNEHWVSNVFSPSWVDGAKSVDVDVLRGYASQPIPAEPEDRKNPVCGSTACVAGWIAIKTAPPGSRIGNGHLVVPGKGICNVSTYARDKARLDEDQAYWLFSASRTRDEVLEGLAYLQTHPDADGEDLDENCGT